MSSIPHISLTNFLNEDCQDSRYVLTSPRSLQACKKLGIKPIDLLPRTLSQVTTDISKHTVQDLLPTRECTHSVHYTSAETCRAVWEELEKERCERLELARRERDQIIIKNYRDKKKKETRSNSSFRGRKDESNGLVRSDSSPNLLTTVTAKPNTRSLVARPGSSREQRTLSPNFSLAGTLMSRKGLVTIPRSEKKVLDKMMHKSVEEEYAESLKHYWSSLWEKQRAQVVADRNKREQTHQKQLADIQACYEREENMSRSSREREERRRLIEKERRIKEMEDRYRGAMERKARHKEQEREASRNTRSVKKRLQEHRLRVSQLRGEEQQRNLDRCVSESAVRSGDNRQDSVLEQKRRAGYRNVVWEARSKLAHVHTQTAAERARELNRSALEDKMGAAEIRQLLQRDATSSASRGRKEKECLKSFQQQLSLRQQEADKEEWLRGQEDRRREREGVAEVRLRVGHLSRARSASENRRHRAESHQDRMTLLRENEWEWRRSVAEELEEKEKRASLRAKQRSLEARESKQMADMTESLRDTIKEQSGKKGFNELVKSTEQFHRLGYGPRGSQKNLSYSHILS